MGLKLDNWKLKMDQYYKETAKDSFITHLIKSGFKIIHKENKSEN
jgi:hypothetical protein